MKSILKWIAVLVFVIAYSNINGQEILLLREAINISLENNFNIRLVKQDVAIAHNNNSLGNAGFLPRVNLSASQSASVTDAKQEYLSGAVNDRKGAKSNALNAGLQLNWVIFDGFRMFTRQNQLGELEKKSELQLLLNVENTISSIYYAYYTLVQQLNQKRVLEKTLEIDNERLKLSKQKLDSGAGSRLELLQAGVDLNADSALYMNLNDQIGQTKIRINQLLGRNPATLFTVATEIEIDPSLHFEPLKQKMLEQNTSLQLSANDEKLAQLALREIKARQIPEIGVNMAYNFVDQNSESGFISSNRSLGLTYGLNASISLFNGFNTRREQQNLSIMLESSRIRIDALTDDLLSNLYRNFGSYTNKLRLLSMEKQNLQTAYENLDITSERFKLGDISGIEFREAQRNYLQAELRLLNVTLEAKLLETTLLQLSGSLRSN